MSDIDFNCDKILKITHSLNPNKTHGHDGVSVRLPIYHKTTSHYISQLFKIWNYSI